ncbi:hypothetical protein [Specibacter sp. NPDC078692]
MSAKPNMLVVAGALVVPAAAVWAALIYICNTLVAGAAVVLDIFSRSL